MAAGTPRIIYTDLDGTLLGRDGSLFRTAAGKFTMDGARALKLCHDQGLELSLVSGRSNGMLREDARVLGAGSYIGEAGCFIADRKSGRVSINCGPYGKAEGLSVFDEIDATGAPALLFDSFPGMLEYHLPWSKTHHYSHLMRGYVDPAEADAVLEKNGLGDLRLVDNGVIEDRGYGMQTREIHAYHIIPRQAGKGSAIRLHLEMSGLSRGDAIACGDSAQDLEMAAEVGTLYLMANAVSNGLREEDIAVSHPNVIIVDEPMVEGFLQSIRQALDVSRS